MSGVTFKHGMGTIHYLALSGDDEKLREYLLSHSEEIDLPSEAFGDTPLILSTAMGSLACCRILLELGMT